jgi:hypothetical protein
MKIRKIKRKRENIVYYGRDTKYDFLKNWGMIRKWAIYQYGLKSSADIDMLLFLYSEKLFTRTKFQEYASFMSWDRNRFDRLLRDGFISIWRKKKAGEYNLYELSFQSKKMIASMYRKLIGLEPFPETPRRNKVMKPNASYSERMLAQAIKRFNSDFKEHKQYPSPEQQ